MKDTNMAQTKLDFNTVTKLTKRGNYQACVDFVDLPYTFNHFIERYGFETNPDFQRGNVWNEPQQISFIEFLLRGGRTNPFLINHSKWTSTNGVGDGEMVLVDGLQRYTAIELFLSNKLRVFGGYLFEEIENLRTRDIQIEYNVNNLKTRKEVLQWYVDINSGGTVHTDDEINKVKSLIEKEN